MSVITRKKDFQPAVPVIACDKAKLPQLLAKLSKVEQRWVTGSGFEAAPHTHLVVPGAKGEAAMVLVGVRDARDPWALASLPMKLPQGRYELGKGPLAIPPEHAAFSWDLGAYKFARYLKPGRKAAELQVEASPKVEGMLQLAEAQRLVRDLVNTPTEDMGPEQLSNAARNQAKLFGGKFQEVVGDELLAKNFPAIHAWAGSSGEYA